MLYRACASSSYAQGRDKVTLIPFNYKNPEMLHKDRSYADEKETVDERTFGFVVLGSFGR